MGETETAVEEEGSEPEAAKVLSEPERVENWRRAELEKAGYPTIYAKLIARQTDIDLHKAIEMIENGADPNIAADILL